MTNRNTGDGFTIMGALLTFPQIVRFIKRNLIFVALRKQDLQKGIMLFVVVTQFESCLLGCQTQYDIQQLNLSNFLL